LTEDTSLRPPNLPTAPASGAGAYFRAGFVAIARAALTRFLPGNLHLSLGAEDGLVELKDNPLLKVFADLGLTLSPPGDITEE
jgi:hypothetical protein